MTTKQQAIITVNAGIFIMMLAPISAKLIPWSADTIIVSRMAIAAPVLLAYLGLRKQRIALHSLRDAAMLALLGAMLAWHWVTYFKANQVSTLAVAIITVNTLPIWITFLEPLFSSEKLQTRHVLFSIIGFAGIVLMVEEYNLGNSVTQGVLFSLVSALLMALRSIWSRKYVRVYNGSTVMFWQLLFGAIALLPFAHTIPSTIEPLHIGLLLALAIFGTALAHTMVTGSMKYLSARATSLIGSIQPVYGIIVGYFLFSEVPSLRIILGGLIVISVVVLETRDQKKAVIPTTD